MKPGGGRRPGSGRITLLAVAVALSSHAACGRKGSVDLQPRPRDYSPDDYRKVLDRWTRSDRVIRHFDTVLNVHATYISSEYVRAHAALYAKDYRLSRAELLRYQAKRLSEVKDHHEFFMAASTGDFTLNDFDRRESIWKIRLVDDKGTRVAPLAVKRIRVTAVHRSYFPFTTIFHQAYHLVFPQTVGSKPFITPRSKWFKLVIASPLGNTTLAWFVKHKN